MYYANLDGYAVANSALMVAVGYVLSDRRPASITDYVYHLFTFARVEILIETDSGATLGLTFVCLNIGPTFRYDKYTVAELLTIGQIANSLSWIPDFNFETWYALFAPPPFWEEGPPPRVCDHSFPPSAWASSQARTESGITNMGQYCGQDSDFYTCFRGANHVMFDMKAVPSGGGASNTIGAKHGRYCTGAATCGPL